ncbi:MAG TPA: CPBP family intramembrane glutamic endopeptidase [Candidatus Angelobacter sp.]
MGSTTPRLGHLFLYPTVIAFEWLLFAFSLWHSDAAFVGYVARVLHHPRSLRIDIPVALLLIAIAVLLEPLMVRILGQSNSVSVEGFQPHNALEVAMWIVMSISAGISEETVFRGYLQQQFGGWTRHSSIGIAAQDAVFGLCHAYQGWRNVVLIFVLGSVFGLFALLRKGLRANIIAHACVDILGAF